MTELIATYDFTFGNKHGSAGESVKRGEAIPPTDHDMQKALQSTGAAVTPEQWAKRKPTEDSNAAWAERETAANEAQTKATQAATNRKAAERMK